MVHQQHWLHLDEHKLPQVLDQGVAKEYFPHDDVVIFENFVEWDHYLVVIEQELRVVAVFGCDLDVQSGEQKQHHLVQALKIHELVWNSDHVHERPDMPAELVWRQLGDVVGSVKVAQVLPQLPEERLVKRIFFNAFGVDFVADQH